MCLDILEIFCGENIRQCLCYIVLGIVCCPVAVPYLIYKATCGKDQSLKKNYSFYSYFFYKILKILQFLQKAAINLVDF